MNEQSLMEQLQSDAETLRRRNLVRLLLAFNELFPRFPSQRHYSTFHFEGVPANKVDVYLWGGERVRLEVAWPDSITLWEEGQESLQWTGYEEVPVNDAVVATQSAIVRVNQSADAE